MRIFRVKKKKTWIIATSLILVFVILLAVFRGYVMDYYHADEEAIQAFLPEGTGWKEDPDGKIIFAPENATAGFIFYPGGMVEYIAYIPSGSV